MQDAPPGRRTVAARFAPFALMLLALGFVVFVRIRLLEQPLERDEGEYAYAGQLILDGILPYQLAYNMKLPGTYFAYAAIMGVFGQSVAAIHLGLLTVNAATIAAVFALARRLFDATAGVGAAAAYALLSLGPSVLGTAAHATHFVTLPAVAGACLLAPGRGADRRAATLFLAGLLMGAAFVMKQTSFPFGLFGGLWLCWCEWRRRPRDLGRSAGRLGLYALGVALPFALVCGLLWRAGLFERFWFWTVTYAREYATQVPLGMALDAVRYTVPPLVRPAKWLWLLAAAGGVAVLVQERMRGARGFTLGFLLFSFLAVCPGFHFREHYYVVLLPAVSILAGAALGSLRAGLAGIGVPRIASYAAPGALMLALLALAVRAEWPFYFRLGPAQVSRWWYGLNPFPESIPIGDYLRAHAPADARIAVIGSEPQIYFYAGRHSATGHLYMYGLMEPQALALEMQRDMIAEIEAARPDYMVFVNVADSWHGTPESHPALLDWYQGYAQRYYETAGIVDMIDPYRTEYRWDDQVKDYRIQSQAYLLVLRRRSR